MASFTRGAFCLLILLACPYQVFGQGFQGTIRGTVLDPSDALIPGATVTSTNVATGESRMTISSDAGTFNFPNLLVSTYTVTVELPGFKKYSRENVQVSANSVSDVLAKLELGGITEEVIVTAGEERVKVSTAQLVGITTRNVTNLPNAVPSGNPNNVT